MPEITQKLGLEKPLGSEPVSRSAYVKNLDLLENNVVALGKDNQTINKVNAVELKTDTRTTELVHTDGNLTQVLEKDGASVVKTTTLIYDGNGNLTSVEEVADSTTVTTTLNYNSTTGDLESVTKVVL